MQDCIIRQTFCSCDLNAVMVNWKLRFSTETYKSTKQQLPLIIWTHEEAFEWPFETGLLGQTSIQLKWPQMGKKFLYVLISLSTFLHFISMS